MSATQGEASFTVDGADLHQITIVGLITSADEQSTNLQYNVDDGTDQIMVKMWCVRILALTNLLLPALTPPHTMFRIDADADETFAERRAQWKSAAPFSQLSVPTPHTHH